MNEHFINTHVTGRRKQTVIHPAHIQSARHAINKPRAGLCQIYGLHSENTPLPAGVRGGRVPPLRRAVGTVAHPRRVPVPTMPHCSARAACETRGKRVCFARWALLSYQRRRHNSPGVLTILPSGESKPWPGSKPAGETCCRTAWLVVTMAPPPWWLMAPEDAAASPLAWLYRTPAKHHQEPQSPMGTLVRVPWLCQHPESGPAKGTLRTPPQLPWCAQHKDAKQMGELLNDTFE